MKYKHLFFDLDHTLWDFDANARATLEHTPDLKLLIKALRFSIFYKNYLQHNEMRWKRIA